MLFHLKFMQNEALFLYIQYTTSLFKLAIQALVKMVLSYYIKNSIHPKDPL